MKRTLGLIILLTMIAALLGWNYFKHPFAQSTVTGLNPSPSPQVSPSTRTSAGSQLTVEQKVAQVLAYPVVIPKSASSSAVLSANPDWTQDLSWIAKNQPAVITLFGSKVSTQSARLAISQIRAQYPSNHRPLFAIDHEGGTTQRLNGTGFTSLPSWQSLCQTTATGSAQVLTTSLTEVKNVGINMVLAPVVDVATQNSVLGTRVCSGDPQVVITRAAQFAQLAQSLHLLPVFKHFPGIGAAQRDLHTSFDRVTVTPTDALVYKQLLDQFPAAGVLVSHIGVTNQHPDEPCSQSSDCIDELTTNYPQVLVMSDALDMKAASFLPTDVTTTGGNPGVTTSLTLSQVAENALRAGDQVLLFSQAVTPEQLNQVFQHLVTTYHQDQIFQNRVDKAVAKIQTTQANLLGAQ